MIAKLCDDENNDVTDEMPTKKEKPQDQRNPWASQHLKSLGHRWRNACGSVTHLVLCLGQAQLLC